VEPVCVVSCFQPCRLLPLLSVYLFQRLVNRKVKWRDDGLGNQLLAFQVAVLQSKLTLLARLGSESERKAVGCSELLGVVVRSPCLLSKPEVEDAHWLEQAKERGHPAKGAHPRLRLVEEAPLVE